MEEVIERHRAEKKALQAKVQSMKNGIPKGDKKKKKEVTTQIEEIQEELKTKHESEMRQFEGLKDEVAQDIDIDIDNATGKLDAIVLQDENVQVDVKAEETEESSKSKVSKAQKRRDKKAQEEKERRDRIANEDVSYLNKAKDSERRKFTELCNKRGLKIHEVPSDGDCMYKALEHQLSLRNVSLSVNDLRKRTSDFLLTNRDDFIPFLVSKKSGEMMTFEEFDEYCSSIRNTKAWGGQIELQALASVLKSPIEVLQADGPPIEIGDKTLSAPFILSYHRHAFHLGEHYNSLILQ